MKYLIPFLLVPLMSFSQNKGASPIANSQEPTANRNTYAVVVGISDYQDKDIPDLRFADKDALAFDEFLRSEAGGKLDRDHLKLLLNEEATMAHFANALDWLMEVVKEGDRVIIYFSGHGDVEKKTITQPGYLLCWDAPSRVYLAGGALALPMFQDIITTLSSQNKAKVIVITDACRSGKLAGSSVGGSQITGANLAKQYANEIKILSCQPNEFSIEGEQWGGGRGAFSYNLVNALYGFSDDNNDMAVSLKEVARYLDDHVNADVAPVSQNPQVIGNPVETIAKVDGKILAKLRINSKNQIPLISSVEAKGFEELILTGLDTSIQKLYMLFKTSLKDKVLLEPRKGENEIACADAYYERLLKIQELQSLHSTIKRNYATALQDDAQQAMNIWLKADVQQLLCIGKKLRLESIPKQLKRAAELLGSHHFMFASLQARQLLFEGILLQKRKIPDENQGRACLTLFRKSADLEPQSPLPWHQMSQIYLVNLRATDSAFYCAKKAMELSPNWVLPMADLAYKLLDNEKFSEAKSALEEAEKVDPNHPYVINRWANWFAAQPEAENRQKAYNMFTKYRDSGGPLYPCWYNDFALLLSRLNKLSEAEQALNIANEMDSTNISVLASLGRLYSITNRIKEAETILMKANSIDSSKTNVWIELGYIYGAQERYSELEYAFKKAISLDSLDYYSWFYLGAFYADNKRFGEAELYLKKTISLDSTIVAALQYLANLYVSTNRFVESEYLFKKAISIDSTQLLTFNNLGLLYLKMNRYSEAETILKKAISLNLNHAYPYRHLGFACFKTYRPGEARQYFQKALELNPGYASAMLGMAYLLQSEGETAEAIGYVEQAIGKGITLEQLEKDEDLVPLRATPEWMALMKKNFSDKIK